MLLIRIKPRLRPENSAETLTGLQQIGERWRGPKSAKSK